MLGLLQVMGDCYRRVVQQADSVASFGRVASLSRVSLNRGSKYEVGIFDQAVEQAHAVISKSIIFIKGSNEQPKSKENINLQA